MMKRGHLEWGDECELPDKPYCRVFVPLAEVDLGVTPGLMPGGIELRLQTEFSRSLTWQ